MKNWIEPATIDFPAGFIDAIGGNPLVARLLYQRGISDKHSAAAFLDPGFYSPASPLELGGMEKAVARIIQAQVKAQTICVWGDFDVDGQTSTALLVSALQRLGINCVFHVPLREKESHGVNIPVLKRLIGDPNARDIDLLLTCDTGISSNEELSFASNCGVDVIVTDHHELPDILPDVEAIINPKFLPVGHALRDLPGVGVAFKLVEELYSRYNRKNDCEQFLDLVALGIVADIAYLSKDTRYLLQRGLEVLKTNDRTGLKAVLELNDLNPKNISEEHLGFIIGPRFNAAGRLDDAKKGVELLTTNDPIRAGILALELETFNERRKMLTNQVYSSALVQLEKNPELGNDNVIVLSNPNWPAGIIGIAASRMVERFNRPVILISTAEGEIGRGSARSIPGVDIAGAISAAGDLLVGHGGHPMAAGISIEIENIPAFYRALSDSMGDIRQYIDLSISIDEYVELEQVSFEMIEDIERISPYGPGNPPPIFVGTGIKLLEHTTIGRGNDHLKLTVGDRNGNKYSVLWWNGVEEFSAEEFENTRFDLAYSVRSSNYRGSKTIQIEWIDYQILDQSETELKEGIQIEVIDYRHEPHPIEKLVELDYEGKIQVFAESDALHKLRNIPELSHYHESFADRYNLQAADNLVIWTTPPGRFEMGKVIETVSPQSIVYFCVGQVKWDVTQFLDKLIGLVKYGLKEYRGIIDIRKLASALAQREATIIKGLLFLEARGYINLVQAGNVLFELREGDRVEKPENKLLKDQLKAMLRETESFHTYIHSVKFDDLKMGI